MRKKWLVIGGVGLVILVLLAALLFNGAQGNACEQFLKTSLKNEASKSYDLLADNVKEQITKDQWKEKVAQYYLQYNSTKTTYKLEKTTNNTDPETNTSTPIEQYLITTAVGKMRGYCHLDANGKIKAYTDEQVYE